MRIVAIVVVGGLFLTVLISGILKLATRTRPVAVVRHLRRNGTYKVKIGPFTNAWTPEPPNSATALSIGFDQMPGRGTLTYTLASDSQLVRMRWEGKRGLVHEWSGPIPVTATPEFERRNRWTLVIGFSIFFASVALGAIAGATKHAFVPGVVAGLIVGYFVGILFWASQLTKSFRIALADLRADRPASAIGINDLSQDK